MAKMIIMVILGIILAVISIIFVTKNFLVKYKGSDNGFKNAVDILLIVGSLVCSLLSVTVGFGAVQLLYILKNPADLPEKTILYYNQLVDKQTKEVTIAIIVGYICFILAYLLLRTIQKGIQREVDRPKNRWDWNKIDKN